MNINNSTDISYRYKMEPIHVSLTGRGSNCHTILTNIINICNSINTSKDILINYIANALGCSYNDISLKGHYDKEVIQKHIFNFINFAVICNKCNIPELVPAVIKNNKNTYLKMTCSACGHTYELIGNNKINQKLVDFMIKYYSLNQFTPKKGSLVMQPF